MDLDDARQKEIVALEAKLTNANYFDLLGVPPGASADEVKAAFRELSRKFHPDRYFGKNLGEFKAKLDRIFKKLVEANQTLTDPEKREAYLAANPVVRAAVRASGSHPVHVPAPKTEAEEARDAERRARLARHPYLAKASRVHEFLGRAKELVEKHEYSQAFTHLTNAAQVDPQNVEVKTLLAEVRKKADAARSESSFKHGLEALERGDESLALQAFKTAVNANSSNHLAAYKAAQLAERMNLDARETTALAQKAVEADPRNPQYRIMLGRLLMGAGMKALAKKHFEEAQRLAPDDPEVKKHVKKGWPF